MKNASCERRKSPLHEATMTALALDAWREQHGNYPASLTDLVPQYLPQVPIDYSTGNALRYTLKDGQPLFYGLGKNGTDEGGTYTPKDMNWPDPPDMVTDSVSTGTSRPVRDIRGNSP